MGTRRSKHNKGRKVHDSDHTLVHLTCGDCFNPFTVSVKALHVTRYNRMAHRCHECSKTLGPLVVRHKFHGRMPTRTPEVREADTVRSVTALANLKPVSPKPPREYVAKPRAIVLPVPALEPIHRTDAERHLYKTWNGLRTRAGRKWFDAHICDRWRNSFVDFAKDMGTRPSKRHQLRRLDAAKPYGPDNCAWFTVDDERRARLKVVPLSKLQEDIVRPGIEKHLLPLLLYKGSTSLGRIHRLWNFAIAMMHTECDSLSDGVAISNNPDFSHLCGPVNKTNNLTLRSFFSRMRLNPVVTENIQGFTEFVEHILPRPFLLRPVDPISERRRCAPWREFANKREKNRLKRENKERWAHDPGNVKTTAMRSEDMFYPFVMYEPNKPMDRLVAIVHACVPTALPSEFRADICQDLIVELLAGDLTEDALVANPRKYVQPKMRHYRYDVWQHQSMDDVEMVDILQSDEAKRQFDEYVEHQLSDVFRVTRDDDDYGNGDEQWADA